MTPPTLTLGEAARRTWDVLVVGAGPAGALAARQVACWGLSVLLVDRAAFPRWKVCGCCLNGRALAVLQSVGVGDLPRRLGAVPLAAIRLAGRGRQALVPLEGGVALSREALDAALVRAAVAQGVVFLPGTQAALGGFAWGYRADARMPCFRGPIRSWRWGETPAGRESMAPAPRDAQRSSALSSEKHDFRTVLLRAGDNCASVSARLVLAADGLGGRLFAHGGAEVTVTRGSWVGAGTVAASAPEAYGPGTVYMACGRGGYVGLVRLEDGRLNVAAAFDPEMVRRWHHPGGAAVAILDEAGLPSVPALASLPWKGTPPLTRRATRLARSRLLMLGDAAGYVQPFTGEGIAWALAAGRAVAPLAARAAAHWQPGMEGEWAALYRRTVAADQATCRVLMSALRHPHLMGTVIAALGRFPGLAAPVLLRVHQAARQRQGVRP